MPSKSKRVKEEPEPVPEEESGSDDYSSGSEDFSDDFSDSEGSSVESIQSMDTMSSRTNSTLSSKRREVEQNITHLTTMVKELKRNSDAFDESDLALVMKRIDAEKQRLQRIVAMEERFSKRLKTLSNILSKRETVLNRLAGGSEGRKAMNRMPDLMDSLVSRQCELEKRYTEMSAEVTQMLATVQQI